MYLQAERCVVDLDVPHFHHEIVYEAIQIALEAGTENVLAGITELLKHLFDAAMVTVNQLNAVSRLCLMPRCAQWVLWRYFG